MDRERTGFEMQQISSYISTYFGSAKLNSTHDVPTDDERLTATICQELDALALATVNAASIANAIAFLRPLNLKYPLSIYMPPEPAVASVDVVTMAGIDLPTDALSHLAETEATLRNAKFATFAFESKSVNRNSASESLVLSAAWRCAASALLECLGRPHFFWKNASNTENRNRDRVRTLLAAVRDGASPSVSATGDIVMADWTERRGDARRAVGKTVTIHVNAERKRGTLADISVSGLGLTDCQGLEVGDMTSVELPAGRLLTGFVMWSRVDRAGVRLVQPLNGNDVLFTQFNIQVGSRA